MRTRPLLFILCAAAGCTASNQNDPPILRNDGEYVETLKQVEDLTRKPFEAFHEGDPISEEEKANLVKADRLIDGLIAYKPDNYGPYILRGISQRALGNKEEALRAYKQGLEIAPKNMSPSDIGAVARIHDELASFYFEEKDYATAESQADDAIGLLPNDASLLTNAAGIKVQRGKVAEAKALLQRALAKAPDYGRAKDLLKLIQLGSKGG